MPPKFGFANIGSNPSNIDPTGIAMEVAKYGIPLATLLSNRKRMRELQERSTPDLEEVNLPLGTVRDMQRPTMAVRSREPMGSSLSEQLASQKFSDAFQTQSVQNFEMQNAQSKIAQEQAILERAGQQEMINADIRNRGSLMDSQLASREYLYDKMFNRETIGDLFGNFQLDMSDRAKSMTMGSVKRAEYILKFPEQFEEFPELREAAKRYIQTGSRKYEKQLNKEF